jgi:hypothetical protein
VYVNDLAHALDPTLGHDQQGRSLQDFDGLGYELEQSLGTEYWNRDTDGDGIWDGFEVLGIRGAGLYTDQALPSWGADPLHKDVFVETDYSDYCSSETTRCTWDWQCKGQCVDGRCQCGSDMDCHQAGEQTRAYDERCVAGACVACGNPLHPDGVQVAAEVAGRCSGGPGYLDNPDGRPGFALHVDNGHVSTNTQWGDWGGVNAVPPNLEPGQARWYNYHRGWLEHLNPIRQGIFRYAVGAPDGPGQGNVGLPWHYFVSVWDQGSGKSFIHELGHSLGLEHYGEYEPGSNHNYKPHYVSLMNYAYSGCSPNPAPNDPDPDVNEVRKACDWSYIRFSEGERRYVLNPDGTRKKVDGEDVLIEIDPSGLDERLDWHQSDRVKHDLQHHGGWYNIGGTTPWHVDWDRSYFIEQELRKRDVLLLESDWFRHEVHEEALEFGPQLAVYEDVLVLLAVQPGENLVRAWLYHEPDGCDPENVGTSGQTHPWPQAQVSCGQWTLQRQPLHLPPLDVASQLSAVTASGQDGLPRLFVFYTDSQGRLCAIAGDPNDSFSWEGPVCRTYGIEGPPEAIAQAGDLLVYVVAQHDEAVAGEVRRVRIDPDLWRYPPSWDGQPVRLANGNQVVPLTSWATPAVAKDPASESLLLVASDDAKQLHLFAAQDDGDDRFEKLRDEDYWRAHPRTNEDTLHVSDVRPALQIERADPTEHGLRWTLWYSNLKTSADDTPFYRRVISSYEPGTGTAFSRTTDSPEWIVMSREARNVSMAVYRGKLRAAVSYDAWLGGARAPGFMFLPLADGVFSANLKDVNDVEAIARRMASTITGHGLFHGMSDEEFGQVLEANRIPPPADLSELRQGLTGDLPPAAVEDPRWFETLR